MLLISRRKFLKKIFVGTAVFSVPTIFNNCSRTKSLPNIVYILADDLGYGDVSCLNENSKIKTANLDALAKEGRIFTDAHSGSAVCTPTRYGILTGRYAWRSRLKSGVLWGYSPPLISPERLTVASLLKNHGYTTGCVGKWHLGLGWQMADGKIPSDSSEEPGDNVDFAKPITGGPNALGFDYFFGIPASLDMFPYVYLENNRITAQPDRETENSSSKGFWRKGLTGADFQHEQVLAKLTEKAVDFIDRNSKKPFFLYFPLSAPHTPILPTKDFQGKSGTNAYGDFVLQVDWTVGQIVKIIERKGISKNTLFIFTSDNGCSPRADFEELGAVDHHPSYVFRGHKADIYEGGHRIPFIVRWPEKVRAGSKCDEIICLSDLMATAAAIVDEKLPDSAGEDSINILPAFLAEEYKKPLREAIIHHSINGLFSIRQGKWKLEMCPGSGGWSYPRPGRDNMTDLPPIQLYDLENDLGETTNVYDKHPEVVERLTDLLTQYVENGRSTPGTRQRNDNPSWWEQLNWMEKRR